MSLLSISIEVGSGPATLNSIEEFDPAIRSVVFRF